MTVTGPRLAPGYSDYLLALQDPQRAFTDPALQQATLETTPLGLPAVASGASAVVFKATVDRRVEAIRCYTNIGAANRERYTLLGVHLAAQGPSSAAWSMWREDAVTVNGDTWPVLRMEWVEGLPLDRHVDGLVRRDDRGALGQLAADWLTLTDELIDAEFAHGDLQHGNVLIEETGKIRLVDLDSVWVPEVAKGAPPAEVGHPNYQHPSRTCGRDWGRWVDGFSALVIYVSLRAVAQDPAIWLDLHDDERLLLGAEDYRRPGQTAAWARLAQVPGVEVARCSSLWQGVCRQGRPADLSLRDLLDGKDPSVWWLPTVAAMPATAVRPAATDLPWAYELPTRPVPPPLAPPVPPMPAVPASSPASSSASAPAGRRRLSPAACLWLALAVAAASFAGCAVLGQYERRHVHAPAALAVAPMILIVSVIAAVVYLTRWLGARPRRTI
jgi:hypothetical protein